MKSLFSIGFFFIIFGSVVWQDNGLLAQEPDRRLWAVFEKEWQQRMQENPVLASTMGDSRYNHLWPDLSLEKLEQNLQEKRDLLGELKAISIESLGQADQLNYLLFEKEIQKRLDLASYQWYLLPLNQRGGIQTANEVVDQLRFKKAKDYRDWLSRLNSLDTYLDQTIALMREGIKKGMVHPKVIMSRIPKQIAVHVVDDPEKSLFFTPFKSIPDQVSEKSELVAEAKRIIARSVVPGYRKFLAFFEGEYLPACYDRPGIWQLPRGKALYTQFARQFTTTDLSPEAIHKIGLTEVKRIREQMETIIEKVGFEGNFEAFLQFLRTDARFYHKTPEALLDAYRALSKKLDPELVKLFGKLPRMPYGVTPIPDHIAPDTTTAYYQRPAADGSRAGQYFVNLYKPETRPIYEMEALSIHEAVPGHHLQIALAMELGTLPRFRRFGGATAFVEGWALYSESLGEEMGFYKDPYSKFGQLTYEMWRAVRLVVDTGIHYYQWDRQKAIDFFSANAAKTLHDITNEVDRYIAWPGQALAYKMGELKIMALRKQAEKRLGTAFDIRGFHDEVLSRGAIPLDILASKIEKWIHSQAANEKK